MTRLASLVCCALACAATVSAQQKPPRPAATTRVATVNGKPMTAGDLSTLLRNAPESVLPGLRQDAKRTLINYTLTRQLSDEAVASKLDQQFPYKQMLDWQVSGALMNSQLQALTESIDIPESELRAAYTKDIHKYRTAKTIVIRILNATNGGAAKAKAVAEDVVRQARAGADFAQLGEKYSSEPDLAKTGFANIITPTFDLPLAAQERLFATLPGQVTDPLEMKDSYVIFKMLELKAKPFADVRADIRTEMQQQRSGSEIEKVQKGIAAKVVLPQFFAANAPNPEPGAPSADSLDPAAVVAEINGRKYTGREMHEIMQGMAPTTRQGAAKDPAAFLIQFETVHLLADAARKAGLDKKPPASDIIRWMSDQVLFQAMIDDKTKAITSKLEEQQDYYAKNQNLFRVAQTKLIQIGYAVSPPPGSKQRNEAAALERALQVKRLAEGGSDFTALVKEYSDEPDSKARGGDMGLRYSDPNLPAPIRDAVFAARNGQVTAPVRLPNGIYLFQVKENSVLPFEQVRNDIYNVLADEKFKAWFDGRRDAIMVTIDDEAALNAELAYH